MCIPLIQRVMSRVGATSINAATRPAFSPKGLLNQAIGLGQASLGGGDSVGARDGALLGAPPPSATDGGLGPTMGGAPATTKSTGTSTSNGAVSAIPRKGNIQ